jgi:hypothetical protein
MIAKGFILVKDFNRIGVQILRDHYTDPDNSKKRLGAELPVRSAGRPDGQARLAGRGRS